MDSNKDETNFEKYQDLFDFLEYLKENSKRKNSSYLANQNRLFQNRTNTRLDDLYRSYDSGLPVALLQLLIFMLVLLIVVCMCKCNKIMKLCRDRKPKTAEDLENERYHDKMKCSDYFCCLWYNYKMRRRLKKGRIRRFNNNRRNARRLNKTSGKQEITRDSSFFRRRKTLKYKFRKPSDQNGAITSNDRNSNSSISRLGRITDKRLSIVIGLAKKL